MFCLLQIPVSPMICYFILSLDFVKFLLIFNKILQTFVVDIFQKFISELGTFNIYFCIYYYIYYMPCFMILAIVALLLQKRHFKRASLWSYASYNYVYAKYSFMLIHDSVYALT